MLPPPAYFRGSVQNSHTAPFQAMYHIDGRCRQCGGFHVILQHRGRPFCHRRSSRGVDTHVNTNDMSREGRQKEILTAVS